MDILFIIKAIIIAIVEGLTEFIPVSSTGHMIMIGSIIDFKGEFADMFEVVIQLGAILAIVALYWKKTWRSVLEFLKYIFTAGGKGEKGFRFWINVLIGTVPAIIMGFAFHSLIKEKLFSVKTVAIGFVVGGILLIIIESIFIKKMKQCNMTKDIDNITYGQSIIVGIFQCLAMWPGMSRSASTIMGGWVSGMSTTVATEFSFFLAIPAMIGASFLDLIKFNGYSSMTNTHWIALIVGFIVAFISALIVVDKFVQYLKKKPMRVFAVYRIFAGIVLSILIYFNIVS